MRRLFNNNFLIMVFLFICAVLIAIFAMNHWFSGGTIFYYWDANLPMDTKLSFQAFFYPWLSNKFPGYSGNGWSWLPYWALLSGLKYLFQSLSHAQFSMYVILLIVTMSGFFVLLAHLLTYIFGKTTSYFHAILSSSIVAFCYTFNLYTFYYAYYMFNPQMYTIAFLPWNFLALVKLFPLQKKGEVEENSRSWWWIVLYILTQIGMIPGFTTYVFLAQYLLFISFYFILYWIFSGRRLLDRMVASFIVLLIITGVIHWIWFYPSLLGFKNLYESQRSYGVLEYLAPGSVNTNLLNLLRLIGSAMMNNNKFSWDYVYTSQSLLSLPLFVFPFTLVFLGWKLKQIDKKMIVLFLTAITLVSLFIMKLTNPPFAEATIFLFKYVPLFGAFRDSVQKAGLYFLLSYFLLIGIGFVMLLRELCRKRWQIYIAYVSLTIGAVMLSGPFFLFAKENIKQIIFYYGNKQYTLSAKTIIPKEYDDLKIALEPLCRGNTTMVIPRTSAISSAVWEQYGYSYVGQDYLLNLINCNFISTHLIQNNPDSFITSPYLMIQEDDFTNFKKFLLQNDIALVVIRKDYVPYYFTQWVNIDPIRVRDYFEFDGGFEKKYENSMFVLYRFNGKKNNRSYGFSLVPSVVYTNASLKTAQDYVGLFKILPASLHSILMNNNDQAKKYATYIHSFVARANCVGCVKVLPSKTQENTTQSVFTRLKRFIKSIVVKISPNVSVEKQISMDLINANYIFSDVMDGLDNFKEKTVVNSLQHYTDETQKILDKLFSYEGDFFSKNNKLIETRNFLIGQNDRMTQYQKQNVDLIAKFGFGQSYYVALLQKNAIDTINTNIWETDLYSNVYKMRLDLPRNDEYMCRFDVSNEFKIVEISIDRNVIPIKTVGNKAEINTYLKQGSIPLEVTYDRERNYAVSEESSSSGNLVYSLGELTNGSYSMRFDVISRVPSMGLFLVVDEAFDDTAIMNLIKGRLTSAHVVVSQVISTSGSMQKVGTGFLLNSLEKRKYYAYYLPLHQLALQTQNVTLENFLFQKTVGEDDIMAFCIASLKANGSTLYPTVKQISPVAYTLNVPKRINEMFLSFNQSFDTDWKVYAIVSGKRKYFDHIQNGYANAWFIDDPNVETLFVEFDRLGRMRINAYGSSVIGIVLLGLFFISYYGVKRH